MESREVPAFRTLKPLRFVEWREARAESLADLEMERNCSIVHTT